MVNSSGQFTAASSDTSHGALQIGAVTALVADYLVWPDRIQIWIQNSLNKNRSGTALIRFSSTFLTKYIFCRLKYIFG